MTEEILSHCSDTTQQDQRDKKAIFIFIYSLNMFCPNMANKSYCVISNISTLQTKNFCFYPVQRLIPDIYENEAPKHFKWPHQHFYRTCSIISTAKCLTLLYSKNARTYSPRLTNFTQKWLQVTPTSLSLGPAHGHHWRTCRKSRSPAPDLLPQSCSLSKTPQ